MSLFPGKIRRNDLIPGVHYKKAAKMVDKPVSVVHVFVETSPGAELTVGELVPQFGTWLGVE